MYEPVHDTYNIVKNPNLAGLHHWMYIKPGNAFPDMV